MADEAAPAAPLTPRHIRLTLHPTHAVRVASLDPCCASVARVYADYLADGYDTRPTIALSKLHINLLEIKQAVVFGRLKPDRRALRDNGSAMVTKGALEPVWRLPGAARCHGRSEAELQRALFEGTGVRRMHRPVSNGTDRHDAITRSGIEVGERIRIPDGLIPADARVEIAAKIAV
ncbi:MAG: hypothetical protein OEU94_16900, partial [Aquincola sp.]|nr:hypothetical protein [Aquincola sp.]